MATITITLIVLVVLSIWVIGWYERRLKRQQQAAKSRFPRERLGIDREDGWRR